MKNKFLIFIFFLVLLMLFSAFVYASDTTDDGYPILDPTLYDSIERIENGLSDPEDTSVNMLRVSPSDTSGFHAVVLTLLGDYNPVVKDYTYQSAQGYTSHSIEITPDWSWIASAFIFVVVLYSFFRILGVLFGGLTK